MLPAGQDQVPRLQAPSAITYDQRLMSFKGLTTVSLWALAGSAV